MIDVGAKHVSFCACALLDKIYICAGKMRGGRLGCERATGICRMFDTRDYSWREVVRMRQSRYQAACSTFHGRMVVYNICLNYTNVHIISKLLTEIKLLHFIKNLLQNAF